MSIGIISTFNYNFKQFTYLIIKDFIIINFTFVKVLTNYYIVKAI